VDFQVRITEEALADLEEILDYSWANLPGSRERFANALLNHVDLLKSFPYIGSPVADSPGVRQLVHTPILIH
jgi:plasmid stabilization system protein ParE